MNKKNKEFLEKVNKIIEDNLSDSLFTAGDLAQQAFISRSQLHRKLTTLTEQNTSEYIRSSRLEKAAELLVNTDKRIIQIAMETGFNNFSWFSKCFKEKYGETPTAYKRNSQ